MFVKTFDNDTNCILGHNFSMKKTKLIIQVITLLTFLLTAGCQSMKTQSNTTQSDALSHLDYLEQVEGAEALAFAKKNNVVSDARLKTDKRYKKTYEEILKIVTAKDKLPFFYIMDDTIFNFWQDNVHIKGILRKSTIKSFNTGKPSWKTVLDVDALGKNENENWVYKGITCLEPTYTFCMIHLSRGGKDARVSREFNLKTQQFVKDGFYIPESKSDISWYDENTLLVGDATNPTTLTSSGYPSEVKLLKRGAKLSDSKTIFRCLKECMSAWANVKFTNDDKRIVFLGAQISFYLASYFVYDVDSDKTTELAIPQTADFKGLFNGRLLFVLRDKFPGSFPAGSLLSLPLEDAIKNNKNALKPLFIPTSVEFLEDVSFSRESVWVSTLRDVKRQLYEYHITRENKWLSERAILPGKDGNLGIAATNEHSHHIYFNYTDYLTPTSIIYADEIADGDGVQILQAPKRFNAKGFKIAQLKTISKDGTSVPYFIVYPNSLSLENNKKPLPTLMYGYGGFEISMTQNYLGSIGKVWLERGGVYVVANIRGGGEYGPDWHKAALLNNRHKAYEDFYAVAEDLIKRNITTPKQLGIKGGSNGGLLTAVAYTQRPELFNAVISEVPLANMLEYHKWLAGASWTDEYGNPDTDSDMKKYLASYSPLHNLSKDKKYPEVFFLTSTKDDRVHPAHARQMVARMQELGHPVLYNENTDGGHGRASNMKDLAEFLALEFTYLYQKLF